MPTKENSSLPLLISPRLEGENNREYAYRVLRQNIITLQFAPGQTLSEAELSEKLEMSRTPVHEAVMMLKNEWLVDVQAQRGSSVSMIRVDYLREGFNMRLMLEASIMQQLAGRLTMQQLKPFAACIEAQAKVANTGNYETPGRSSSRWTTTSTSCCTTMAVTTAHGRLCTTSPHTTTGCAI